MNFCAYVCDICNTAYADGNKTGHPKYFCLSENKVLADNKFKMKYNQTATVCPKCYANMHRAAMSATAMTTNRQFITSLITKMIFDKEVLPYLGENCPVPIQRSELQDLVDQAREFTAADYTDESWAVFVKVLNCSIMTLADRYTTQDVIDDLLEKLTDAMDNLIPLEEIDDEDDPPETGEDDPPIEVYTRERLQELIDAVSYYEETEHTVESWQELQTALGYAETVIEQLDPEPDDLKLAIDDLRAAIDGLDPISEEV